MRRDGIGIGCTPFETRADVIVALARLADELGLASFGVAEAMGRASPVLLAELAQATERIEIASGVLSVWSRSPGVLAMTAAELQRLSGGRFVLGLGASTPPLTEGLHGIPWEEPFARTREVVTAVRALLAGERLPSPARGAHPLRLVDTPDPPVPITLAALAPPSVRLAGELGDRWTPFLWPRPRLDEGRALLGEGAQAAGRGDLPGITPSVPLATGPDQQTARAVAARWLVTYCTRMGPVYPRMLRERFGYAAEVDALLAANGDDGGSPTLPPAASRLAEEVTVLATHDDLPAAIDLWTDVGADEVGLTLPFGLPADTIEAAITAAAR